MFNNIDSDDKKKNKTKITTIIIKSDFFQYEPKVFLFKVLVTNLINKVSLKLSKVLSMCKK